MPRRPLIQTYLHGLHALPADVVDELTDGLIETYEHHRARVLAPDEAACGAIEEFGATRQVLAAFDQVAPGRRASRRLPAAGPLVGLCWATALVTARAWSWPIPTWVPPVLGTALMTVIALLLVAARSRRLHWALFGVGGVVILDLLMISGVLAAASAMSWPLRLAITASLARTCFAARTLPALRTR